MNIKCSGIPSFSAMCMCAKLGGFAMMASATKGLESGSPSMTTPLSKLARPSWSWLSETIGPVPSPASIHDLQHPRIISYIPARRLPMSPFFRESIPGMSPGFLTIKAMSSAGSPPMLKNSSPFSSTKVLKVGWVAKRTRCPYFCFKTWPKETKGWTSPREPTTCITTLSGGGGASSSEPKPGGI